MEMRECEDHNNVKNEVRPAFGKKFVLERIDLEKLLRDAGEDIGINKKDKPKMKLVPQRINLAELLKADKEILTKPNKLVPQRLKFSQPDMGMSSVKKKSLKQKSASTVGSALGHVKSFVSKSSVKPAKTHVGTGTVPKKKPIVNVFNAKATGNLHGCENLTQGDTLDIPTIISESSPAETEFRELEKLIMNQKTTPKTNHLSYRQKIENLLEDDKLELLKYKTQVMELTSDFVSMQEKRHSKILQLLRGENSPLLDDNSPLREISSNLMPNHSYKGSMSDGKILKRLNKNLSPDKSMKKALGLYNSMRSLSKSILNTPKMDRKCLATPLTGKTKQCYSISKIIQKQCLMLHDTPTNK